ADRVHCDCLLPAPLSKRLYRSTIGPLELVARPQCPVVEVAAWLALLYEFPRVKDSVVGLKPEVTIRLPAHLCAWTMSDETRFALPCWNNQKSRDRVPPVAYTLPP